MRPSASLVARGSAVVGTGAYTLSSSGNDLVFAWATGRPLDGAAVRRGFTKLKAAVGLTGVRFHDLRHTAATLMLKAGVHPKVVSERLGHATIAITLDTYSHVLPDIQRDAAEAMDRLLTGRTDPVAGGS